MKLKITILLTESGNDPDPNSIPDSKTWFRLKTGIVSSQV